MRSYSGLLCIVVHPKRFTIMWGGVSPQTPWNKVLYNQFDIFTDSLRTVWQHAPLLSQNVFNEMHLFFFTGNNLNIQ